MNGKFQLVSKMWESVDLNRLARMKPDELHRLHRALFGCDLPFGNVDQARRKIAWRIQADREGALPESARQHALAIARQASFRLRARVGSRPHAPANATVSQIISDHDPRVPMPGSVIVKEYRGRTLEVYVLNSGFEYNGRRFTSLSAIAKEITGTKWNGVLFFGLAKGESHGR
jgi:hypothetical protein